jgi:hypothetical protein
MAFDIGTFLSGLGGSLAGRAGAEAPPPAAPAGGLTAAAPVEEELKIPETTDEARGLYFKELSNLRRQQQALLASLEARAVTSPGEMLRNISAAMLDPGRTGNFGEAFGRMQTGLSRQAAEESSRAEQIAKMRLELNQQNVGMAEKGVALAQEMQRTKALSNALGGASGAEVAGAEGVSPSMIKTAFDQLDNPTKEMIRSMPSDKAMQFLLELVKQQVKTPEAVLTAEHWINTLPENVRGIAKQFYANTQLFGSAEARVRAMLEINSAVDEGKLSKDEAQKLTGMLTPSMPAAGASLATSPAVSPAAPVAPATAPAGKPAAVQPPGSSSSMVAPSAPPPRPAPMSSTSAEGVMPTVTPVSYVRQTAATQPPAAEAPASPSRVLTAATTGGASTAGLSDKQIREQAAKVQEERRAVGTKIEEERRAEEREARKRIADSDFKSREDLKARANDATQMIQDAQTASRLARTQPGAFGIINKPGLMNALFTAAESTSRLGFFSLSVPEIQSIVLKAGGTQQQLNAVTQLEFIAIKQQLAIAAAAKGSVSNFERELFGKAFAAKSDDPNVIIWKSNLLQAKALFERDLWKEYRPFERANKGSFEDFRESQQFRDLEGKYKTRVEAINKMFIK